MKGLDMKKQDEFVTHVLESLPHPFYVVDANDYTVKMANYAAAFGSISQRSTCYALTHNRSTPCSGMDHACPLNEVKEKKKAVTMEHVHYDQHGNTVNVEVHAYPVFNEKGSVSQVIVYTLDITERKKAEEARVEKTLALTKAEELKRSRQRILIAQESVRREIAQQLHGSVQNRIIILLHKLTELESAVTQDEIVTPLKNLHQQLMELLDSYVRPISHRLYPYILRRGLIPALESLGDQIDGVLTMEMKFNEGLIQQEKDNVNFVPEVVRIVVYRLTEEALNNIVKHANASKVFLNIEVSSKGSLCLTVRDNGQGFNIEEVTGRGLSTIRDYADLVGGKCVIRSAPEDGTEVRASFPLEGHSAEHPKKTVLLE